MADFTSLLSGLGYNLLMVLLSAILPTGLGIGMTFVMRSTKSDGVRVALRVIGAVFYSLAPPLLLICFFFNSFGSHVSPFAAVLLTLVISHLGFFMMCYEKSTSAAKNIVVNLLGLLSSLFMWSLVVSIVGNQDLLYYCKLLMNKTYDSVYYVFGLVLAFVVLATLNIPRMILKEKMK